MRRDLEDPVITRTMKTGYPCQCEPEELCECCGEAINEECWEHEGKIICRSCVMALAVDEIHENDELAAEIIGAERRSA